MNHAAEKLTQVGAALGFTATTGQGTGVMVSGVLASNNAENTIHATIGSDTAKTTIIDNMAYDAGDLSKSFDQDLENNSINVSGSTYLGDVTDNAATNGRSLSETHDMTDRDYDIKASNKEATKQMGAAIAISLSEVQQARHPSAHCVTISAQMSRTRRSYHRLFRQGLYRMRSW